VVAFFRNSTTWVIDYRYEGRSRRWVKVFPAGLEPTSQVCEELRALHGDRATSVQVRVATAEEESQFLRGEGPRNVLCPTGRSAVGGNG
jgi:hypothetical protein